MSAFDSERVQRMDADLDLLNARIEGVASRVNAMHEGVGGLSDDVAGLAENILALSQHVRSMAELLAPMIKAVREAQPVSGTGPAAPDRKVWVAEVPEHDEYGIGPISVMIEQFGDKAPSVAFRREQSRTWGRPHQGVQR